MSKRTLDVRVESFATRRPFVISRGARSETLVVTVTLEHNGHRGRGECVPYRHYDETPERVREAIESAREPLTAGCNRQELLELLPAGAARNGIDAALWDLEARASDSSVWLLAEVEPKPIRSGRTLSLDTPTAMADEAAELGAFATLKLKLDGDLVTERVAAVQGAVPNATLIVDANEAWPVDRVEANLHALAELGVELVEQPVPPADDEILGQIEHPLPVCADEAFHTAADIERIVGRYDAVNLKLDKTGGLTHALIARREAERCGLGIMVGCMLSSSLSIAPALVLAQGIRFVDLDGPYLLADDREPPLRLSADGWIESEPELWGG